MNIGIIDLFGEIKVGVLAWYGVSFSSLIFKEHTNMKEALYSNNIYLCNQIVKGHMDKQPL